MISGCIGNEEQSIQLAIIIEYDDSIPGTVNYVISYMDSNNETMEELMNVTINFEPKWIHVSHPEIPKREQSLLFVLRFFNDSAMNDQVWMRERTIQPSSDWITYEIYDIARNMNATINIFQGGGIP